MTSSIKCTIKPVRKRPTESAAVGAYNVMANTTTYAARFITFQWAPKHMYTDGSTRVRGMDACAATQYVIFFKHLYHNNKTTLFENDE